MFAAEWIEDEAEAFESGCAKQRIVAGLADDDHRIAAPAGQRVRGRAVQALDRQLLAEQESRRRVSRVDRGP